MTALLDVKGLKAFYGQTQALHGIEFGLADGGITTLLGANGAGKTTVLDIISGFNPGAEGKVLIGGTDVSECSSTRMRATARV